MGRKLLPLDITSFLRTIDSSNNFGGQEVQCLSKFFARYKDIFGQWFAVTPQIATTEPPGTMDLETLHKKASFDTTLDIDLSRGGVYDPNAVDTLIT